MKKFHLYHETLDWGTYWRNFLRQDKSAFLEAMRHEDERSVDEEEFELSFGGLRTEPYLADEDYEDDDEFDDDDEGELEDDGDVEPDEES